MSYKLISFDKIPSTQVYAHELIANGVATDRTVIVAEAQSAGRGRYRRIWVSHHGNLYASFIYSIDERDPKLSYAVAVSIAETLISFGISPNIKWPNDILINEKKVSGVLIEYAKDFVIIGIGINIKTNPTVSKYKTDKLDNYVKVSKSELLSSLMKSLDVWLNRDFSVVRKRWMDLAAGLNKTITHRGKSVELIGINENGALVLRNGPEYIMTYGDEISI
ncbi:MAG: biotin--[acetyl-CoA-carboxylase] ligase [Alphaproteobacteria bacterium]|jgi:BirA family biotin operon repressor/biotin-[acetyl-CoA-carboxylase] ligase|nr:biotin--[acetyl-CoA-carboxylase] ligase [Alphaproteobacteria bacterium]MBN2675400.1 biotin--[acetyl-CoA-carboxylase] ligase [Alphaproteobacteria bacterium]